MLWDIKLQRPVKSHDVVFFEEKFPGLHCSTKSSQEWFSWSTEVTKVPTDNVPVNSSRSLWHRRLSASVHNPARRDDVEIIEPSSPNTPSLSIHSPPSAIQSEGSQAPSPPGDQETNPAPLDCSPTPPDRSLAPTPPPRRSTRDRRPPDRYGHLAKSIAHALASVSVSHAMVAKSDPQTYKEAVNGPDREKWLAAMRSEMDSLVEKDVFELVPLPKGKKAIGSKGAYRTKPADSSSA